MYDSTFCADETILIDFLHVALILFFADNAKEYLTVLRIRFFEASFVINLIA